MIKWLHKVDVHFKRAQYEKRHGFTHADSLFVDKFHVIIEKLFRKYMDNSERIESFTDNGSQAAEVRLQ